MRASAGSPSAIRLAAAGRRVVVLERNDVTGGKLAADAPRRLHVRRRSVAADPARSCFDELFRVGRDVARRRARPRPPRPAVPLPLARRLRARRARRPGRTGRGVRRVRAGRRRRVAALRRARPAHLGRQRAHVPRRADDRTASASPRRMRSPADLAAIDPLRTLHRSAAAHFADPRLVQWAGRYATYSGSSPFRAPATLACIPHVESRFGCWYPRGGLDDRARGAAARRRVASASRCARAPRSLRIATAGDAVTGVELADGSTLATSLVVANADAEHVYGDLLPDAGGCRRVRRAGDRRAALVVLVAAVRARRQASATTTCGSRLTTAPSSPLSPPAGWPTTPTIYACVSSVTDPTQAPPGDENWFLLVNAPPGIELDRDAERDRLLDVLAGRGVDLRAARLGGRDAITPARPGRPVPRARRGDLRDVVERPAGGVPAAGQPRCPARPVPRRRIEPPRRRTAARADQRPHRRRPRHADDRWAAGALAGGRPRSPSAVARRRPGAARRRPPVGPQRRVDGHRSRRRPGARRGDAHRTAAGGRRRRAGCRRGDRRRRRVDRRHRRRRPRVAGRPSSTGEPLPAGWVGKAWALQQGLDAASGEWVVFLDADTRPSPDLPGALVARARRRRPRPAHRRRSLRLPDRRRCAGCTRRC